MKTNSLSANNLNLAVIVLNILAAVLIFSVLTGRRLPLLSVDRAAVVILVALGMAICSQAGIGRVAAIGAWSHPLAILGYLLGGAILLIGGAALFGKLIPPMTSFYQAFLFVAGTAVMKVVIASIHRWFL